MASVRKRSWTTGGETRTAWIADYFDQRGKRHVKTFKTKKAADAFLVQARHEVARGVHAADSASIIVAEAGRLWLARGELEGLERSTLKQYREHTHHHINPFIGSVKLARLSTPEVEEFRDDLLGKGSRAMARKVLGSLKSLLSEAQRRGLVAQNAAQPVRVDVKKRERRRLKVGLDIPAPEEMQAILGEVKDPWRPLIVTAIFTGMRGSELRGLLWDDVDFKDNIIHVRQRANLWGEIGAPKSAAGNRAIPMSPLVRSTLIEWRVRCPRKEGELVLVFPDRQGEVEKHANIANRGFGDAQMRAGIVSETGGPKYSPHLFRHFFASWAINQGFSPKRVQELLGHSTINMTFDVYGHLFPNLEDDHARFAKGEELLLGTCDNSAT